MVATDELKPLWTVALQVDGSAVPLDDARCAEVTWGPVDVPMELYGRAQESGGWWGGLIGESTIEVVPEQCPAEPEAVGPQITVVSPEDGARVAAPTDVVVTVDPGTETVET